MGLGVHMSGHGNGMLRYIRTSLCEKEEYTHTTRCGVHNPSHLLKMQEFDGVFFKSRKRKRENYEKGQKDFII